MAHRDAREGKWRGKMRMEWVASNLALDDGARSVQLLSTDPHSSTASSRLNWHPRWFKWTRPFSLKDQIWFLRMCHHVSNVLCQLWHRQQDQVCMIWEICGILNIKILILWDMMPCNLADQYLFNHLTPNDHYSGRTAPLNSKRCILYIYSTNIYT